MKSTITARQGRKTTILSCPATFCTCFVKNHLDVSPKERKKCRPKLDRDGIPPSSNFVKQKRVSFWDIVIRRWIGRNIRPKNLTHGWDTGGGGRGGRQPFELLSLFHPGGIEILVFPIHHGPVHPTDSFFFSPYASQLIRSKMMSGGKKNLYTLSW